MCGWPCSGKTTRAIEIKNAFLALNSQYTASLLNDEREQVDKHSAYSTQAQEKHIRAAILSSVERCLGSSTSDLVICDAMNYIKSMRYQMYCNAREVSTPHCVVHCVAPLDKCRAWNKSDRYPTNVFDELVMRFEEPNEFNRWDAPLFTVQYDDPADVVIQKILDSVTQTKRLKNPTMATNAKQSSDSQQVTDLDQVTNQVIAAVMLAQKESVNLMAGCRIHIPNSESQLVLKKSSLSLAELRRLRRQFLKMHQLNGVGGIQRSRLSTCFVDYLNTSQTT